MSDDPPNSVGDLWTITDQSIIITHDHIYSAAGPHIIGGIGADKGIMLYYYSNSLCVFPWTFNVMQTVCFYIVARAQTVCKQSKKIL